MFIALMVNAKIFGSVAIGLIFAIIWKFIKYEQIFPCSSAVEQSPVKRLVVGSIPTGGAQAQN